MELAVQYLGLQVDEQLLQYIDDRDGGKTTNLNEIMDKLLATHPNHNLKNWIDFART